MGSTERSFDYVICGGGTAGCVLASRLAEAANVSVLVIEAGEHNRDLKMTHMAGAFTQNFETSQDWCIESEPLAGNGDRRVMLNRGKFLGGSSGCNATLCVRGIKQDYDDWGVEGWSGEEMFEYMKKAETFHGKPWFKASPDTHGNSGPLHTEPHDFAPISTLMKESCISKGPPFIDDLFATGEAPEGCGHVVRTVHKGIRTTAADYLQSGHIRGSITLETNAVVDRILITESYDGSYTATGVVYVDAQTHAPSTVRASREVVIAAGSFCSPAVLMRSGIGPRDDLASHGIDCIMDLPGIVWIFYESEKAGLTNDCYVYHTGAMEASLKQWEEEKSGVLTHIPCGVVAYSRVDDQLKNEPLWTESPRKQGHDPMGIRPNQPNIELLTLECYTPLKHSTDFPADNQHAFGIVPELFGARTRGSVRLKSTDPLDNPIVDCQFLADPLDMLVMSEACRFANEIMTEGQGTKDLVKGSWPPASGHNTWTTREQWISWIKENITTCYHPAGTCKMGRITDPLAVVDEKLRVKGIKNLRVADCSIMPGLNSGHTQMPAYAIGEKCADMIKEWS
ncbi:choline dehydrogenase [Aspergillus steynii IBT 23096]|uniref:Choline dehydrogenase n=1 Tax=Aspergillus steynii IBT 23096 TaxID=1392250 RepID=A0A2I2FRQ5_9EURO|nr:choline dehydrogenase [Aspergillus steynii IBT 23096]PLB43315.1 choline dehydrogenase [Aspergillus steynii IBT 23096]